MKKLNTLLAASALALVSASANAAIIPVTMTGTGVTHSPNYLGFPVNGTSVLTGSGFYNDVTGITSVSFNMVQTNIDPFYSAGVLSIDGEIVIDNNRVPGPISGTTTAHSCSAVDGNDACAYVGVGVGPIEFTTMVFTTPYTVRTTLIDGTTGALITQNLTFSEPISGVPVPAAAWLFGSAIIGLVGVGRKKKRYN